MNIGTMGAATILMNNNTRMMRGGGGGGSNNDDNEKPKGLGKMLLVMTLLVIGTWAFHMKPDFWYVNVKQTVVDKDMMRSKGSKDKIYDSPFIKVETQYVEVDYQWVKRDSTLWIRCNQQDYLNYNIGQVINEKIVKPSLQGWSTFMTWIVVVLFLIWTFILSAIFTTYMD
jgi:hypothetical protein